MKQIVLSLLVDNTPGVLSRVAVYLPAEATILTVFLQELLKIRSIQESQLSLPR